MVSELAHPRQESVGIDWVGNPVSVKSPNLFRPVATDYFGALHRRWHEFRAQAFHRPAALPRLIRSPTRPSSSSGFGGGPDRCVVKVPDIDPGKIPKPASISGKMTKSMVRYEAVAFDPTAVWRIVSAPNLRPSEEPRNLRDLVQPAEVEMETTRRSDEPWQIRLNSTQEIQPRGASEGNLNSPLTGFSVVVTGWEQDPKDFDEVCGKHEVQLEEVIDGLDGAVSGDFGIPSWLFRTPDYMAPEQWNHQKPSQGPDLAKQWLQNPRGHLNPYQFQYPARQWNSNSSNDRAPSFFKSLAKGPIIDSPEFVGGEPLVGAVVQKKETTRKSFTPGACKYCGYKWVSGHKCKQNQQVNLMAGDVSDEAQFDLAQLYVVRRADKRLRCTGLFWKLPPWPDFCTMNCDRFAQHCEYEVIEIFYSVKQYNHSALDYTDKFEGLIKIWPDLSLCEVYWMAKGMQKELYGLQDLGEDEPIGLTDVEISQFSISASRCGVKNRRVGVSFDRIQSCEEFATRSAYKPHGDKDNAVRACEVNVRRYKERLNSDASCCVCGIPNLEPCNQLLECIQCYIKVHQACYGVLKALRGQGFCRPCKTNTQDIVCILYGYGGGAMTEALKAQNIQKSLLKCFTIAARSDKYIHSSGNARCNIQVVIPHLTENYGTIRGKIGKEILDELIAKGGTVKSMMEKRELVQIADPAAIEAMDKKNNHHNMSVIAHVDHGKSTLTDSLVAAAGIIVQEVGDVSKTDTRIDEAKRGITIKSTGNSLFYEITEESLRSYKSERLWGENFSDPTTKKWTTMNTGSANCKRGFVQFYYEPIKQIIKTCMNDQKDKLWSILRKLGVTLKTDEKELMGKTLIKSVMKTCLLACNALLEMMIFHLPFSSKAQEYRVENLYKEPLHDIYATAIRDCNLEGSLMLNISEMIPAFDKGRFLAFGHEFSRKVVIGKKVRILGPNYDPGHKMKNVQRTDIWMVKTQESVEDVHGVNTVAMVGRDQFITKKANLTNEREVHACPTRTMKLYVSPVVRVAAQCQVVSALPKLVVGLKHLAKFDSTVLCTMEKSGEPITAGAGDLHLEICLKDLLKMLHMYPFRVLQKIGKVAYKLQLPDGVGIHFVLHVSKLKKHCDPTEVPSSDLPLVSKDGKIRTEPIAVLKTRALPGKDRLVTQWLVTNAEYTCPNCYVQELKHGMRKPLSQSAVLGAKDLSRTVISDHMEDRLFKQLKQERQDRANQQQKSIDEVFGVEGLVIRVVSSVDKKLEVKPRYLEILQEDNYPTDFPYQSKAVLLSQKMEGVEVCLFGMYDQEFEEATWEDIDSIKGTFSEFGFQMRILEDKYFVEGKAMSEPSILKPLEKALKSEEV